MSSPASGGSKDCPIPVIDIAPLLDTDADGVRRVAAEMRAAARDVGFFYIANHGVPERLVSDAFRVSREFFEQPLDRKRRVRVSEKKRGYIEPYTGIMQGGKKRDFRETFLWGREFDESVLREMAQVPLMGPNQWPDFLPEMKRVFTAYFEACIELGRRLLTTFALSFNVDPDYFTAHFDRTMSRGSSLYYPPQGAELGDEQYGIGSHTDWGVLTVLAQDEVGGLQVQGRSGEWLAARPVPGTFVVNVGDCLERWTNRKLLSNEHRAVNRSDRVRQAIAVFVDPNFDTEIVPVVENGDRIHFEPAMCGDIVLESFRKAYG